MMKKSIALILGVFRLRGMTRIIHAQQKGKTVAQEIAHYRGQVVAPSAMVMLRLWDRVDVYITHVPESPLTHYPVTFLG